MPFDPDAFLNEESPPPAPAPNIAPEQDASVMPPPVQPRAPEFDPDQFLASENAAQYGTSEQQWKTFGEGAARGFASQPIATLAEVKSGIAKPEDILGRQKENPWINAAGETAGFVAGAFGPGEASLLARVLPKASAPIKALIDGFALTGGDELSHYILKDPDQTAGSAAAHIGLGTILSGALGSVSPLWSAVKSDGVGGILNLIKEDSEAIGASMAPKPGDPRVNDFMKKAINVVLGPSEQNIDARVTNLEAIRTAPEFQDVYDHVLNHLETVGEDVAAQKKILADAESEFKASGYDAALAAVSAKAAVKDAQTQLIQDGMQGALSKAPAVANAVELLRGKIIDSSQAAYDILEKSGKVIPLKPLYAAARELQDKVFSQGSPLALQQAEAIGKYVETLGAQYGTEVSAENAKSIIKGLDGLSKYNFNASQFESGLSPVYKQLRHAMDSTLKEKVPAYAAAMKPLAKNSDLLSKLSGYGTPEDAVKSIIGLKGKAKFVNDMPLLRDLENNIGIKFTHELDHYASPNLRQLRVSKIPEYAEAERAAQALAYYKHPETFEAFQHSIMNDPEWISAMNAKEATKGITETSLQGKMNAVMGGKNISARAMMSKLPGLNGMSIPEILDLIAVRQAFEKGAGMGSRNVNLLGGIGGVIGGAIGGIPGASVGAAAGAGAGAVIDRKGPAIAAKLLDKYVDSFGSLPEKAGLSTKAARRALQMILGSDAHPSAEGFKAAAEYAETAGKGLSATKRAAKSVFKKGASMAPVPNELIPSKEKIHSLDNRLKELQKNPTEMFAFGGQVGHYMPNHAESIAKIGSSATAALNAMRPQVPKNSPLDEDLEPSMASKANYHRNLSIAEQPLMLFQHVKNGTLTPQDMATAKNIYPGFVEHMKKELMDAMTDHLAEGHHIPHHLRRGIAALLEQPMDSTQTLQSMQAVMRANAPMVQQMPAGKKGAGSKVSGSALSQVNKVNSMFLTQLEATQIPGKH